MAADEKITVEWIATAQGMMRTLDQMDKRFEKQEKLLQKMTDTGKRGAIEVAGSFNKLEQELKENEAALKRLVIGSKEFDEQRRKVDMLRGSLARAKGELTGLRTGAATFGEMKTSMLAGVTAAGSFVMALQRIAQAQRDIVNTGADAALQIDTMARKFQIQAGIADPEREAATRAIIEQSSAAGVTAESGFQAATQLAGSGFDNAIETGTLKTILDTMQAGSFKGQSDELVAAFSQMMNAMGLEKNNQNLQQVAVGAQSLFKQTDFQLTDLSEFAAIGGTVKNANVQFNEGIAAFTTLRDSLPAGEAATGLRNLITKMQKGDITPEGKKDLERLGVKAEDVDFVGESLTQVLTNLNKATEKLGEADRNAALGKLFGTENVTSARMLIEGVPRIQELQGAQGNAAQFEIDRQTAAGSMQSGRNRLANQELLQSLPIAGQLEERRAAMDRRDAGLRGAERQAAVELGAPAAAAVRMGGGMASTIEDATGADVVGGSMRGESMSTSFGIAIAKWFMRSETKQDELIRLQQEANAIAAGNRPAARQQVPQARPVRPGEAPLPGGLVP